MRIADNESNQLLIEKLCEITNEMKVRCLQKDYFRNLNLDASHVIEFVVNDYIQCLEIYLQTKNIETFKDKIVWFKGMSDFRMPNRNSYLDLLDFSYELRDVTLNCIKNPHYEILHAFQDFSEIIILNFKEVGEMV